MGRSGAGTWTPTTRFWLLLTRGGTRGVELWKSVHRTAILQQGSVLIFFHATIATQLLDIPLQVRKGFSTAIWDCDTSITDVWEIPIGCFSALLP